MGDRNEAKQGLSRFFAHIEQYDLRSNRWKGDALVRLLEAST